MKKFLYILLSIQLFLPRINVFGREGDVRLQVRKTVETFIEQHIAADSFTVNIRLPGHNKYSSETKICRVEFNKQTTCLSGRVIIPVRLLDGSKSLELIYVTADIRLYARAWITLNKLNRGHIITAGDLQKKVMDVTRLRSEFFTERNKIIGKKLNRLVKSGHVLTTKMLSDPFLIRHGDKVEIVVIVGNMKVVKSGRARQAGFAGDFIRVRPEKGREDITACIKSATRVEVIL